MKKIILSILLVLLVSTTSNSFPPPASPSLNSIVGLWASGSCSGFLKSDGTCAEGTVDETDPIVGAVTGLVKANGAGTIGAASAGTDYVAPTSAIGISLKLGDHAGTYSFSILGDDDSVAFSVGSNGVMGGISSFVPPYKEAAPTAYQLEWDTNFLTSRAALCGHDNTGVVCFSGSATAPSADGQFLIFDNDAKAFTPYAMSGDATMTDGGVVTVSKATGGFTIPDAQTLTFDESAADPNDADIVMSAADGVLTIAAANGANNENLTLDFDATSNQVAVNTGTDVTAISLTAINLVTTGTIDGAIPMTGSTDATITVGGSSGWYYNADDDVIAFNLPATPTGKAYCFSNVLYARAITINPDDSDYIVHAGTTAAQGEAYVSSGARTDQVCVIGIDASYWLVTSERGTWAEETP